ncbi:MAG TPA: S41 family peptidase [Acidimicrobiales bacterium]|nr:S41 family peptidase [Acidimicrobiales bacterium]
MSTPDGSAVLVNTVIERLTASYIFPDRSARAASLLQARLADGAYDLPAGSVLCERLSADLFEACADKHLRLLWHDSVESSRDETELVDALHETFRRENHGIHSVELLPGNVGLIALTIIPPAATGATKLAAMMQLVQDTDALILDLRETRGGAPDGGAFLSSFFFPDGDVHLSDIIEGPNGPPRQYWTYAHLPAPRYLDRATIVGETTRGGAHPSEVVSIAEQIELRLPVARSHNPITGTNWEAVGVQPDHYAPATTAVTVAHRLALEASANNDETSESSRAARRHL